MILTKAMKEIRKRLGFEWRDEGEGYRSFNAGDLAYISLPKGHKDIGKDYDSEDFYELVVNGGLTYCDNNVFGWDYKHYENSGTPETDIKRAIKFFKSRMKVCSQSSEKIKEEEGKNVCERFK